jgi:hypothetical protein
MRLQRETAELLGGCMQGRAILEQWHEHLATTQPPWLSLATLLLGSRTCRGAWRPWQHVGSLHGGFCHSAEKPLASPIPTVVSYACVSLARDVFPTRVSASCAAHNVGEASSVVVGVGVTVRLWSRLLVHRRLPASAQNGECEDRNTRVYSRHETRLEGGIRTRDQNEPLQITSAVKQLEHVCVHGQLVIASEQGGA